MGNFVSSTLCTAVGVAYPAYASFKAMESPQRDDDTQWFSYWIIYAAFTLGESVTDVFISWFPFYLEIKLLLLIALQIPQLRLASVIYLNYVRPYLRAHEHQIDQSLANAEQSLKDKAGRVVKDNAEAILHTAAGYVPQADSNSKAL